MATKEYSPKRPLESHRLHLQWLGRGPEPVSAGGVVSLLMMMRADLMRSHLELVKMSLLLDGDAGPFP